MAAEISVCAQYRELFFHQVHAIGFESSTEMDNDGRAHLGQVSSRPLQAGLYLVRGRDLLNARDCGTVIRLMAPDDHTQTDPKHFDQFAQNYHEVLTQQLQASGLSADYFAMQKARIILDEALPKAFAGTWRLLDVGCGNGQLEALILDELVARTPRLAGGAINIQMDGIEVSEKCVEEARRKKLPFSFFRQYDGQILPFEDGGFDVVVFCVVLHHVPPEIREPLLRECRRVLKPGGALIIFEHNPLNPLTQWIVKRCPFDEDAVLLRSGETTRRCRRTGFRVAERRFINFFPNRGIFRKLMSLERWLRWMPMGAQYYVHAVRVDG